MTHTLRRRACSSPWDQVGVLSARAAIRRFQEEKCTVVTYVSHGDCGAKKNPKGMFSVVEKGWCVCWLAMYLV